MKSALALVAFSNVSTLDGITALLETALEALDKSENHLVAAHVDLALNLLALQQTAQFDQRLAGISQFG